MLLQWIARERERDRQVDGLVKIQSVERIERRGESPRDKEEEDDETTEKTR